MLRRLGLLSLAITLLAPAARAADAPPAARPAKPNIVVILIDDLGERDVGCYGSTYYETPNVDKLATQGVRFTQAYAAACICSPTRAALLTGRSPARLHLTDWIAGHAYPKAKLAVPKFHLQLPATETTLAEVLRDAGYATASIGKWHLGGADSDPSSLPTDHGFDVNLGGSDKGQPASYFSPYKIAGLPDGPPGEYLTDRMAAEAEKYIEANKDKPFFLYLPHFAVHTPIQARKDLLAKYQAKKPTGPQSRPAYAALVESFDEAVGRVTKKLDDLKLSDRTIVVFTSDNGGLSGNGPKQNGPTSNLPLRMGKGTLYEGGIRVPLIVRYPPMTTAGITCDVPVITHDLYPTLLRMAGVVPAPAAHRPIDGVDVSPLLSPGGKVDREAVYWHYPHYHPGGATPCAAVRRGDWKLIRFFEDDKVELYNLKDDPGEKSDLSGKEPARAKEMNADLGAWLKTVDAQMPTPNPDWDGKQ